MAWQRIAFFVVLWVMAVSAVAHDLSLSGIRLVIRDSDTVITVSTHRAKLAPAKSMVDVDLAVRRRLKLRFGGKAFIPGEAHIIDDPANNLVTWQAVFPEVVSDFDVSARLFPEDPIASTVITVSKGGLATQEIVLDAQHPSWSSGRAVENTATPFLLKGVEHILSGADHVLFVLGLILLGGSLKSLIKTVTAFTLAHSVTLSLAVTGILNPPSKVIEPLIALSILAIAAENLRPKAKSETPARDYRPVVAFAFGLVHGFGFAGALGELGLHGSELVSALVTFNVGVELGQASIILAVAPFIAWAAFRKPVAWTRCALAGSVIIGMIGSYWFVSRIITGG